MQLIFNSGSPITEDHLEFLLKQIRNKDIEGIYIEIGDDPFGNTVCINIQKPAKEEE
jgi:hypothetical protein